MLFVADQFEDRNCSFSSVLLKRTVVKAQFSLGELSEQIRSFNRICWNSSTD